MKKFVSLALTATISLGAISPLRAADAPKDQKDKVSYAIGLSMGMNLRQQGLDISADQLNADQLASGFKDAISGGQPKLSQEELQTAMRTFMEEKQKELAASGNENKTKGDAFLAENKKKEGWKTLPSGLQYRVIKEGKGEKPKETDMVVTNYRGRLINGKEFDSSEKNGGPAEFTVNRVIPGWTEALKMMPVGAKWELAVPADLAYGQRGAPPDIGPNSVLLFDIELLDIKKAGAEPKAGGAEGEEKK